MLGKKWGFILLTTAWESHVLCSVKCFCNGKRKLLHCFISSFFFYQSNCCVWRRVHLLDFAVRRTRLWFESVFQTFPSRTSRNDWLAWLCGLMILHKPGSQGPGLCELHSNRITVLAQEFFKWKPNLQAYKGAPYCSPYFTTVKPWCAQPFACKTSNLDCPTDVVSLPGCDTWSCFSVVSLPTCRLLWIAELLWVDCRGSDVQLPL